MVLAMHITSIIGVAIVVGLIVRYWQGFSADVNAVGSAVSNVNQSLTRFG